MVKPRRSSAASNTHPQIPKADAEVLTKVKRRVYRVDNSTNICGIGFDWSSIIGFLPAIGDFANMFMALMIANTAMEVSSRKDRDKLSAVMISNIMLDFLVGLVPFVVMSHMRFSEPTLGKLSLWKRCSTTM